jgi:hypothetical protein
MDCFETAFKDNSFDTVIIPEMLEHIRSIEEIFRKPFELSTWGKDYHFSAGRPSCSMGGSFENIFSGYPGD